MSLDLFHFLLEAFFSLATALSAKSTSNISDIVRFRALITCDINTCLINTSNTPTPI